MSSSIGYNHQSPFSTSTQGDSTRHISSRGTDLDTLTASPVQTHGYHDVSELGEGFKQLEDMNGFGRDPQSTMHIEDKKQISTMPTDHTPHHHNNDHNGVDTTTTANHPTITPTTSRDSDNPTKDINREKYIAETRHQLKNAESLDAETKRRNKLCSYILVGLTIFTILLDFVMKIVKNILKDAMAENMMVKYSAVRAMAILSIILVCLYSIVFIGYCIKHCNPKTIRNSKN
ncbi:MAG: hypothetical protein MHMPM18_000856 [Marteilia pararefringens]